MGKKYQSPITAKLTPDNWQELLNPQQVSVDELITVCFDMRKMQSMSKKIDGYLKQAICARLPDDEYATSLFDIVRNEDNIRVGNIDVDRLLEDMGQNFVAKYRKESSPYTTLSIKSKE